MASPVSSLRTDLLKWVYHIPFREEVHSKTEVAQWGWFCFPFNLQTGTCGNFRCFFFFFFSHHDVVVGFHCQLVGRDQGHCSVPSSTQACSAQQRWIRCNVSNSDLEIFPVWARRDGNEKEKESLKHLFLKIGRRALSLFLMMQIIRNICNPCSVVKTKQTQTIPESIERY